MDAATTVMLTIVISLLISVLLVVLLRPSSCESWLVANLFDITDEEVLQLPVFVYDILTLHDLENITVRYRAGESVDIIADVVGSEPMIEFELPEETTLLTEFGCLATIADVEFEAIVRISGSKVRVLFGESDLQGTLLMYCSLHDQ
jgi:hypothetical protein